MMGWEGKWNETKQGNKLYIACILSLLVTEDGNEMIVTLERIQSKPLPSEKPLKALPLLLLTRTVAWSIHLLDTSSQ